jgi:hypothetical protein
MGGRDVGGRVANDDPFEVGERVSIIRARHGWHDGLLDGEVTRRWRTGTGTWKYGYSDSGVVSPQP